MSGRSRGRRVLVWAARLAAAGFGLALLLTWRMYREATRPPAIVSYDVTVPGWTGPRTRVVLLSDTHAALPDMPARRLARVCEAASALGPDLIVLAGDYVSQRRLATRLPGPEEAVAPFAACRARGVFAVLGNHDMIGGGAARVTAALGRAGVTVLRNRAVRAAGVWVAGVDDPDWGKPDPARALARVPADAPVIMAVHNPDVFEYLDARVGLTLAGHTHGGQIAPFGRVPVLPIRHRAWARGLVWDHGRPMVVTSGVGASGVPLRWGVPPEIVLVTIAGTPRRFGADAEDAR